MFRNYLLTAIRSLRRHRFFSAINIFGLAVAMSICMAIMMLVADQMTYDRYNPNRERIFRVNSVSLDENGNERDGIETATTSAAIKHELLEKYTGIEKAVRLKRDFGNNWLTLDHQDINIPLSGYYADPEVFEVFGYEFQYGDRNTALREPYTVVLTRKAADKLFDEQDPTGKMIKVGEFNYTVTGVLKETDNKSHIAFEALASMATAEARFGNDEQKWTSFWNNWVYVQLEPDTRPEDIQHHLDKMYAEHIAIIKNHDITKMKFKLQSLMNITPGPLMNNAIGPSLPWIFVYFLGGLAAVIMLTSCFNFTNLSIARSLTRAREIGVRKVNGAARWQVFMQFISESVVVSCCALCLALILLVLIKPMMLGLTFAKAFRWDLDASLPVFIAFLIFAIFVGILAGFFPAVVLSGLQPLKVLKNLNGVRLFSRVGLRKFLLVSQFTLSLVFILTVIVMYKQLDYFMNKEHGFDMKNKIALKLNNTQPSALKTELLKYNNIVDVAAASHVPASGSAYGEGFKKSLDEKEWTDLNYFWVDESYLSNMGLSLVAGKYYDATSGASNKNFIIINEKALGKFHYSSALDAIGEEIIVETDSSKKTIIGVVQNYNHEFLMADIKPMALMYGTDQFGILQVKYSGSYEAATRTVQQGWQKVNPDLKVDYKEFESEIRVFYDTIFGDAVKIFGVITMLAILISCLGLLGMATYTTETRIKEISIRKVLGSSNGALVFLLSRGFLSILLISIVIAVPAAFFLNNLWLELMANHISVDVTTILIGVLALLVFGAVTIGSQTWRAAFINPAENLKNE